jgi:hypothetical protein
MLILQLANLQQISDTAMQSPLESLPAKHPCILKAESCSTGYKCSSNG